MNQPRDDAVAPPTQREELYLPDLYYYNDSLEAWLRVTLVHTAYCVVQWCDEYVAICPDSVPWSGPSRKGGRLEGNLPPDLPGKRAALDAVFAWAKQIGRSYPYLYLTSGDRQLMYNDGLYFNLVLTLEQFRSLQDCWEEYGLPRDLYYRFGDQRQGFTPKQWSYREHIMSGSVLVGDGYEEVFLRSAQEFRDATVMLRMEIERGNAPGDAGLLRELSALRQQVARVEQMVAVRDQTIVTEDEFDDHWPLPDE